MPLEWNEQLWRNYDPARRSRRPVGAAGETIIVQIPDRRLPRRGIEQQIVGRSVHVEISCPA